MGNEEDRSKDSFFWQMTWTIGITLFCACLPTLLFLLVYSPR